MQELNDRVQEFGVAIAKKHVERLRYNLSNIDGFPFDRTNDALPEDKRMTIAKYDEIVASHIQHIIESDETIKSLLSKITYHDDKNLDSTDKDTVGRFTESIH